MKKTTVSLSLIPEQWVADVWKIVHDEGRALRGPADSATIEVKSLTDNRWLSLMLFSSVMQLDSIAERDQLIARLVAKDPPAVPTP